MSGHSKWATIKRKKAATDAARSKVFTKYLREITIAARIGGGELESNPRLRTAVSAAKGVNMPAANIERAIKKGAGGLEGANYEEIMYEGYGAAGVALLVECQTDNKNRAAGEVRHTLSKYGGAMAEAGAVSYMFKARGLILVEKSAADEDTLMETALDAGADDVQAEADAWAVLTPPSALEAVKDALAAKGIAVQSAEHTRIAGVQVPLELKQAESLVKLIDALEELDDVQKVHANFVLPDEVLAKLAR
jgi:YebC/PmpR family DNA-binding regulatory protein